MSRNITEVLLLKVPLEADYLHTLWWDNVTDQIEYFKSKAVRRGADFSYQRKDKVIRWYEDFDTVIGCNYVMYRNTDYSNKWYYAFITKMEYISDGLTEIHITTDCIQTWFFDFEVKASFVEREHVYLDAIGQHTLPEGLQLGEYISNKHNKDDSLKDGHKVVIASTVAVDGPDPDNNFNGGQTIEMMGGMYGGMFTGVKYYTYNANTNVKNPAGNILQTIVDQSGADAISAVFIAPKFLCTDGSGNVITNNVIPSSTNHKYYDHTENKPFDSYGLEGYQPKNNKLFTYPYCFLSVDNGNGASAIYHYEYFNDNAMKFHVEGVLTPGCSVRMVPLNYKGSQYADREGLNLGKFPICNWASDIFTNWVTQNGVNVATSLVTAGAGAITGAATGAAAGSVVPGLGTVAGAVVGGVTGALGGLAGVANTMNEVHKAEMQPPQTSGNINCGDVITAANNNTFHYYHMSIRKEYAEIIDKYFDMFGYKVNNLHIPNSNHRKNYWYTKTIDVNIDGDIPQEDMAVIKRCYNNGITYWKNPENIGQYYVDNSITV